MLTNWFCCCNVMLFTTTLVVQFMTSLTSSLRSAFQKMTKTTFQIKYLTISEFFNHNFVLQASFLYLATSLNFAISNDEFESSIPAPSFVNVQFRIVVTKLNECIILARKKFSITTGNTVSICCQYKT